MGKKTDKFRQYTSMMTEAGQQMKENMTNFDRGFDRRSLARVTQILAAGVAVVAILYIIHFVKLIMQ